jgi:hypothetical protein
MILPIGGSSSFSVDLDLPVKLSSSGNGLHLGAGNVITAVTPGKYAVFVAYQTQLRTIAVVASEPDTLYIENSTLREHLLDPDGQEYNSSATASRAKTRFVQGEPDDTQTRGLFGYHELPAPNPWGRLVGSAVKVNPGDEVVLDVDPLLEDIVIEAVSDELQVSIRQGKRAEVLIQAGKKFKPPGKIVLVHTPSATKLEVAVYGADGAAAKVFLALVTLVGSGGYIASRFV